MHPEIIEINSTIQSENGVWHLKELNNRIRFCKYSAHQYFHRHLDGIHYRGSQIVSPTDEAIATKIVAVSSLKSEPHRKVWEVLGEEIVDKYVNRTASLAGKPGSLRIVYTAMHGVGAQTLQQVFQVAQAVRLFCSAVITANRIPYFLTAGIANQVGCVLTSTIFQITRS